MLLAVPPPQTTLPCVLSANVHSALICFSINSGRAPSLLSSSLGAHPGPARPLWAHPGPARCPQYSPGPFAPAAAAARRAAAAPTSPWGNNTAATPPTPPRPPPADAPLARRLYGTAVSRRGSHRKWGCSCLAAPLYGKVGVCSAAVSAAWPWPRWLRRCPRRCGSSCGSTRCSASRSRARWAGAVRGWSWGGGGCWGRVPWGEAEALPMRGREGNEAAWAQPPGRRAFSRFVNRGGSGRRALEGVEVSPPLPWVILGLSDQHSSFSGAVPADGPRVAVPAGGAAGLHQRQEVPAADKDIQRVWLWHLRAPYSAQHKEHVGILVRSVSVAEL